MLEHGLGCTAQAADIGREFGIAHRVRIDAGGVVRTAAGGHHEPLGRGPARCLQPLRQRMRDQCPHAVTQQHEGPVHPGQERGMQLRHQGLRVVLCGLPETVFASGQLHRAQLDIGGQLGAPAPVDRGGASRIGKAEQPQAGRGAQARLVQPRGQRGGGTRVHGGQANGVPGSGQREIFVCAQRRRCSTVQWLTTSGGGDSPCRRSPAMASRWGGSTGAVQTHQCASGCG